MAIQMIIRPKIRNINALSRLEELRKGLNLTDNRRWTADNGKFDN